MAEFPYKLSHRTVFLTFSLCFCVPLSSPAVVRWISFGRFANGIRRQCDSRAFNLILNVFTKWGISVIDLTLSNRVAKSISAATPELGTSVCYLQIKNDRFQVQSHGGFLG